MIYKNYEAQISYSEEDEIFFGRVVNLKSDMIAFDGHSVAELKHSFEQNNIFNETNIDKC